MIERRPQSTTSQNDHESLVDLLRTRRKNTPDQLAYQFLVDGQTEGARLTYRQLDDAAQAIARRLLEVGQRGDRALLLYPPGHEFLLAFFGCLRAGIIAVPLPPPDAARIKRALPRLQAVIRDAQASCVLTTNAIENLLASQFQTANNFHRLAWINTESISTEESNQADDNDTFAPLADDIALLQYTSGSTSTPKGVIISHANVLRQCQALQAAAGYDERSVTCTWMPYHHDYGLIEGLILPLFVGVPCYFMSPLAFIKRPHRWLEAITKYGVTHSQAPNFAYDLCVRKVTPEQRSRLDLSSWSVAANAAEPVRPRTLRAFYEAFKECGFRWEALAPAYGLAEATLIVTHTAPGEGPQLLNAEIESYERGKLIEGSGGRTWSVASCGRPLNEMQVEIVNPNTQLRCPEGEVGEIWVAGPSIAQGYWQRPDETEHSFQARIADTNEGPFLRTGDLGCLRQGQLYVTGREKDLLIIRGLNHYPQDIEQTVEASHPALRVAGGAAFSVEAHGEEELVVVYEIQGKHLRELDADAVLSAIREAVFSEHDLRVHAIVLLKPGEVIKTTSGKIQRRAMKTAFLADELDFVASWQADPGDADLIATASSQPAATPTMDAVRAWITNWLVDKTGAHAAAIDPATSFADSGLDSLRAADLAEDLEQRLGRRVDPTIFWNFTTINTLAAHLAESHSGTSFDAAQPMAVTTADRGVSRPSSPAALDAIAIVGMGCRFPGGVDTPAAFWQLLRKGVDAITEIPAERWNVADYYDSDRAAPGKMYARHGGFLKNVDRFDASFFGITPREAERLDPQHRLLLEVAWESIEHAGIAPGSLRGSDSGVFVGLSSDDHAASQPAGNGLANIDAYQTLGAAQFRRGTTRLHPGPARPRDSARHGLLLLVGGGLPSLPSAANRRM